MKKMLFCTVVLLLLILIASGCESSNPNGFEVSMPDKTVEYNPLMKNVEFTAYLGRTLSNEDSNIINKLNDLSRSVLGVTIRIVNSDSYSQEPLWKEDAPDISFVRGRFGIRFYEGQDGLQAYIYNDMLFSYYDNGYVEDISSYINEKTPYISLFYDKYPEFKKLSEINGEHLGIVIPDEFLEYVPVLIIRKSIAEQYADYEIVDWESAYDLCKKIAENRTDQMNKVYVSSESILSREVAKAGYFSLFGELPYIYLMKSDGSDRRVYRIDETDLWDQLIAVKREVADLGLQTNWQKYVKSFINNRIDAAIDKLIAVEMEFMIHNKLTDLLNEYLIIPLYEDYNLPSQLIYFVIGNQCKEKQLALQYIDWLLSDDEARRLLGYGIDGVNCEYDREKRVIRRDGKVSFKQIVPIGTGSGMMTQGFSLIGDIGDAVYIKDKILKNFIFESKNDIRYMKDYAEAFMDFFKNRTNRDKFLEEYRLTRFSDAIIQGQRSDFLIINFFNEDITFELLEDLHWKLKETHDASLVQSMQIFGEYR